PLGIKPEDVTWDTDRNGINRGHSNLFLSPRSLAKFGSLYLNKGMVNGKGIISEEWVEQSITMEFGGYGYCWWNDLFGHYAKGLDGHYIYVLPEEDIVVSFTESIITLKLISQYIIPAVIQSDNSTSTKSKVSGLSYLSPTLAFLAIIIIIKRKTWIKKG
ncbi:MAG: hypothetical protein ACFFAJ_18830, partial [Candidatus Hodarchaeota archaeon]